MSSQDDHPRLSRVYLTGFDFNSSGTITLKAYVLSFKHAPWVRSPETFKNPSPLSMSDTNLAPLRTLAGNIDPIFSRSFDMFMDHVNSLKPEERPVYEFTSMDCKSPEDNRLKVFV